MTRIARIVMPGIPHHVTQRGNRRQQTFFCDEDYEIYLDMMQTACRSYGVKIWAYCLMPNHIHLVAVPEAADSLSKAMGDAHERYSKMINRRFAWQGCLWQGRFFSCPMDEKYLYFTTRYIELNPVSANICLNPIDYRWSSARAHIEGTNDQLVEVQPILERFQNWAEHLQEPLDAHTVQTLKKCSKNGRPFGSKAFIEELENLSGRSLRPHRRGRKPRLDSSLSITI